MKLGLGIPNFQKKIIGGTEDPLGEPINEGENPTLPDVGTDPGPGDGLIYKSSGYESDTITYWESNYSVIDNAMFYISMHYVTNQTFLTWETLFDIIPLNTNTNGETIDTDYLTENENPEYTYTDNDNLFDLLVLNSTNEEAIFGSLTETQSGTWLSYFLDEVYNLQTSTNQLVNLVYKFVTEENIEKIKIVIVNPDQTLTTTLYDLNQYVPLEYYFNPNSTSPFSYTHLLPILSREFKIENPYAGQAGMPPIPAALNLFPTENLDYITPDFAANYNGVTSQNISNLIDRYRPIAGLKNAATDWITAPKNFVTATAKNSAENSKLVSFSTANRQIIVKIIYLNPSKPSAPWYDRADGEVLTLECKIACFGNNYAGSTYANALSNFTTIYTEESIKSQANISGSTNYQGQTVYYSERIFIIDVSNILFTNYLGGTASEIVTVESKSFTGDEGTYKAMLFEVFDLKISSNKRIGKTPNIPYSQTGLISVPTFKGEFYSVGRDMTLFLVDDSDDFVNQSLLPETEKMDSSLLDYEFNMNNLTSTGTSFTEHPCYNQFATFPFENKTGALNANYELVNLSAQNQTLKITINLYYILVLYQDVVVTIREILTNANGDETITEKGSTSILKANIGNLVVSEYPVTIPSNGGKLKYEIKFEASGATGTNAISVRGGITGEYIQTGQIIIQNTKLRPRFNYF